jgi:hypothetical protein
MTEDSVATLILLASSPENSEFGGNSSTAAFAVTDEYGQVQPHEPVTVEVKAAIPSGCSCSPLGTETI